jgi:hypothetical protein
MKVKLKVKLKVAMMVKGKIYMGDINHSKNLAADF